jgi:hypothetical protein
VLNKILGGAGVILVLVAIALGVRGVTATGEDCGSVFQSAKNITPMACDDRLSSRETAVAVAAGAGVAGVVASIAITIVRERREDG